ncbi:FYSH domain-containing protein [Macrolepiota fuliginosa MF-IS2]|uniref:FYSH domain-containing protein n=1 Tax=Macrolepiota fuliginosa MF-IS2 TaxID=1400762 RepID=A0A9P5XFC4_9AGAR|nr:FYSH domain-containing protein [Macrolepiota fuliginosa MF-IS2]
MPKNLTVVVYKPNPQSTDEYLVYVDPVQYRKWKDGGQSIPLVDVIDSWSIYHTGQGTQGLQKQPSNQQLDTIFGTHKDTDVVEYILKNGKPQHGDLGSNIHINHNKGVSLNPTRGGVDSRGKGSSGI